MSLYDNIQKTVKYIRTKTKSKPQFGLVLGTGLGNLVEDIKVEVEIDYKDLPGFLTSTVQSHAGKLIFGKLNGKSVVAMAGRFHYYEGYSVQQVTFPIRVMKFLGVEKLILSNVSGSTNAEINAGDIVLLKDHINMQRVNPLRGENDERLGVRFPDMSKTYDAAMRETAKLIATMKKIEVKEGVYVALQGPNLETPAEYNFLNTIGGDLVGMSTVPEVIVARHSGMRVMVISVVSNKCFPIEGITETTVESVIEVAQKAEPKMREIVKDLLRMI
ncbi:MAG: purine-nucleoside phosphorylase [Paraglaciecola sp.]|jgi:purine-nucleoside phosphorylase